MSDYIDPDLLSQILKLLPVKTLLRFRIVCKSWKQLVDSKPFAASHVAVQKPRLIAHNERCHFLVTDPHTLPNYDTLECPIERDYHHHYDAICSVHGVICIRFGFDLFLWNPSIRRFSRTPPPPYCGGSTGTLCGFWIDPSSNDFKMVACSLIRKNIVLFSSRNQVWTEVDKGVELGWDDCDFRQVLINGVGYWLTSFGDSWKRGSGVIGYFDFTQDKFGTIKMPDELALARRETNVYKWKESLSLLHWRAYAYAYECNLWVRQSGSWTKMFSLRLPNKQVKDVLLVEESRHQILAQLRNGNLMLYDPEIRWRRKLLESKYIGRDRFIVAYEFVESLVFPDLKFEYRD